jgi:P22 coat protein - gene protein 5
MTLNSFIPQLWSDTILAQLRKQLVAASLCNTDYQGAISQMGDTVRINAIGDITISTYTKDTAISVPQVLTDAQTMLTIDQARYYNFAIDDVDKAQTQPKVMGEAMSWAAYRMADTIDQFVLAHYTDAGALIGTSGAPITITAPTQANVANGTTVYDELLALGQVMTQNLCPKVGRWAIVPPWVTTYLTMDLRVTGFNTVNAQTRIQNGTPDDRLVGGSDIPKSNGVPFNSTAEGYLGHFAGFDCYESVNSPHLGGTSGATGSQDACLAGHPMGLTFALGLSETEAYRHPNYFNDAVKGLCLYGVRTVRPNCLGVAFLQHP